MIARVGTVGGAALLLLLGACSAGIGDQTVAPPRAADSDPESSPEESDAPARSEVGECDAAARTGIDETVGGQLAAFAADDYQGALGFASRAFRAGIDAPAFRAMIESEFVVAADASTHTLGACRQIRSRAQVVVEITAADLTRTRMVYSLVEEDGSWLISGAVIAGAPGSTLT